MRWCRTHWKSLAELAVVVLLSSAPLWWFHPGELMKSGDLRWPTLPAEWPQFLYAWKSQIGTGAESIFDASMIIFHGVEALLGLAGWPIAQIQQFSFLFWFFLSGLAVYGLLRVVLTGPYRRVGRLVGVSFYLYNLWQATYWTAYKPPLVVGYALLPAILAVLLSAFEQRLRWRWAIALVGGLTVLASAIGNNPTEAAGVLLPIAGCLGLYGWRARHRGIGRPLLVLAVAVLGLNAFWWVPQASAMWRQRADNAAITTARDTAENWLEGLSSRTSFANVARLQGEWTWESGVWERYVPYDHLYREHLGLWVAGWLIPALAFCGIVWGQVRHNTFFTLTAVCGLILSMGIHPPFRATYLALTKWVPGFWMFRSPYYKFGMMLCLSYAFLLGTVAAAICRWLAHRWRPTAAAVVVGGGLIGLNLAYAFPVTSGVMFIPPAYRVRLPPGRVYVPAHVGEAARWVNQQAGWFRIWTLPGAMTWQTTWGYHGINPVLQEYTTRPLVYLHNPIQALTAQAARHPMLPLVQMLTEGIRDGQSRQLTRLLPWLNVQYVLYEGDVLASTYAQSGREVDHYVPYIADQVAHQHRLEVVARHGPWQWYRLTAAPRPRMWGTGAVRIVEGPPTLLWPWSYSPSVESSAAVCFAQDVPEELRACWAQAGVLWGTVMDATRESADPRHSRTVGPTVEFVATLTPATVAPWPQHPIISQPDPPWQWETGFTEPVRDAGGRRWRWVTDGNANAIGIQNPTSVPQRVMLRLGVRSLAAPRSLMLYLNGPLAAAFPIPADQPVLVTTPLLELLPGHNTVRVYTPAAPTMMDGQWRNFALEDRVSSHAPGLLTQTISVPHGPYEVWVAAVLPGPDPAPVRPVVPVIVDGVPYRFPRQTDDMYGPAMLSLAAGPHTVEIPQAGSESYHLLLRHGGVEPVSPPVTVRFEQVSPVVFRAHVEAAGPHLLIFQESYDAGWEARANDRPLGIHLPVFGYANGWWVDHGGTYEVTIQFTPQRWMVLGGVISVISGVGVMALAGWRP